jgi:hypothetical protein
MRYLVGRPHGDAELLGAALLLEQALGFSGRVPLDVSPASRFMSGRDARGPHEHEHERHLARRLLRVQWRAPSHEFSQSCPREMPSM